ncbi:substrate-binding domain-containing protein [Catenovulum sp. SX2]|uniref:substrate-binding domain-containing protein n=1 Tax=Catenovulum sp. SX2 TaxID=3398614 RepID=UPI003F87031E
MSHQQDNIIKHDKRLLWFGGVVAVVTIVLLMWFFSAPSVEQIIHPEPPQNQTLSTDKTPSASHQNLNSPTNAITTSDGKVLFRLAGSNTIGEKLAPNLVEHFIKSQGGYNLAWAKNPATLSQILKFQVRQSHYQIIIESHGSTTGFNALQQHDAEIVMSSRRIKKQELLDLFNPHGNLSKVGNEHIIALDGLAIIVNQNNNINSLSIEQVAKIFSGQITNWHQVGGANQNIEVYARDTHSGTRDTFDHLVLDKYAAELAANAIQLESSSELSQKVARNEAAVGFIGINYISHNKALAIYENQHTNALYPTLFTISSEDYALTRRLYLYTPTSSPTIVKDFAAFAISDAGQNIVENTGLVSQNISLEETYAVTGAPANYNKYAGKAQRLSVTLRFDYTEENLDNKGKRDLLRLLNYFERHPNKRVVLMGFSDNQGEATTKLNNSLKQAKIVAQALSSRGISVVDSLGFGSILPIASNDSIQGQERNRRVEVWVY